MPIGRSMAAWRTRIMSCSSAATSTPVGPPPTMTKLSSFFRSWCWGPQCFRQPFWGQWGTRHHPPAAACRGLHGKVLAVAPRHAFSAVTVGRHPPPAACAGERRARSTRTPAAAAPWRHGCRGTPLCAPSRP